MSIVVGASLVVLAVTPLFSACDSQPSSATGADTGPDLILVKPQTKGSLTERDLEAVAELPSVSRVAPQVATTTQLTSEDRNWSTRVIGTTPSYLELRGWRVAEGTFIAESDVDSVVLGDTVARELANGAPMIGRAVRIRGVPFLVVGVLAPSGQNEDVAIVPLRAFRWRSNASLDQFFALSKPGTSARAQAEIGAQLREHHHLRDDFRVIVVPR